MSNIVEELSKRKSMNIVDDIGKNRIGGVLG